MSLKEFHISCVVEDKYDFGECLFEIMGYTEESAGIRRPVQFQISGLKGYRDYPDGTFQMSLHNNDSNMLPLRISITGKHER